MYVCEYYRMTFNNITELEIAFDSDYNYIGKVRRMIKDIDPSNLFLTKEVVVPNKTKKKVCLTC